MNSPFIDTRPALLVLALCAALVAGGCDSALDLEPKQTISTETALSTPQNVRSALLGAYEAASDYDLYGGQLLMLPDLLADDGEVFFGGTFEQPREVFNKQILVGNSFVESQWDDAYETINLANIVLSALGEIEGFSEEERGQAEGEAKFLRGVMHFELVRLFGRAYNDGDPTQNLGVPIVTEPTLAVSEGDESIFVERATVAAVYEQVIQDLTDAVELLPEVNDPFADTYAASAMLSRVYLMQGRYEAAAEAASRVIESGLFELAPTFAEAFNNPSDIAEYVFAIQISSQDNANESLGTFYDSEDADPEGSGRGDIDIEDAHLALYEEGDARGDFFYTDSDGLVRTSKWRSPIDSNIPVIRLAEMYLTRAEANFRAGTEIGAPPVEDINAIRTRASLEPIEEGELTLDFILRERKLELAFEGHLLHDLKRTGRPVGDIPFDSPRLVYPIPQSALDANPNLTQNPGYGS